ncbi:protocadherin-17-like isoform X1 [Xyrichtys novacula]|uniref:Protocadherin-17-like isoform X1 n=1 Tax=Xyrichtys novacula TaxID=13765 RepID=A0AAV1H1F8_XYRNO|nr:protocadherin-17-like isoform X1 [Xyrichtys novacula]
MRLSVPIFFLLWVKALTLKNLNYSVPEEQGPGTVIGNIAKDAGYGTMERGKKSNFRVLENSAPHLVDVDPESGLIFTKQRIDRETLCRRNPKCQLSMEVFANDKEICVIKVQGEIDFEENPIIEFDVQAKDLGPNPIPGHCKITVKVLDKNDNSPIISFVSVRQGAISEAAPPESVIALVRVTDKDSGRNVLLNDTAEIPVPRNVGIGYIVATVKAVDHDHGESGHLTYEITEGNDDHLFEMDPVGGEVRTAHALWEEVAPVVELVVKVTDHGKPPLSAVAKLIIKANTETVAGGGSSTGGEQQHWDVSLPLIVTLCIISVMLLAVMTAIAVKSKHQDKEAGNYNCRMAEYSNPPVGKGKKKRINKSDIMLVQSEMEERDSASRMNVVSSPSLITSPICFDYQSPLPLTLPRSEVMYLKTTPNSLTVPRAGCHSSFAGLSTDTPANRMSVIQTENFPSEPNYAGSRQPFVQSSTFKDAERASLRDSGHGDSDQADSDQDTNKGSHCDTSAREALKMKATAVNGQPFEQEQDKSVHCTDECRALGHSDRCWMPKLRVGSQADSADNRTNLFIPVGMDAMVETEIYGTISCSSRKTLSTFGKEQRDSTILVANVKPYLKSQRALSPPLQESPSASSSPTKSSLPLDLASQESKEEREGGSDSSAYGPPDGQCSPLHTELEEPSYLTCELRPKSLSSSLIHSSVISQECGGSDCALDPRDSGN